MSETDNKTQPNVGIVIEQYREIKELTTKIRAKGMFPPPLEKHENPEAYIQWLKDIIKIEEKNNER